PRPAPTREARRFGADPDRARGRLPVPRVNPLRSVGARLALGLAAVVLGALTVVWVALVPTLEHRLVAGRMAELAVSARAVLREPVVSRATLSQDFIDDASRGADARVVYYEPLGFGTISPEFDSSHLRSSADVEKDPVALRASTHAGVQRGRV